MASAKKKCLQNIITEFAIEIEDVKADGKYNKAMYNKAWHKLWVRIANLKLFKEK